MRPDASGSADRLDRERTFHDARFSDDSARAAAGKFYELVGAATARFEQVLDEAASGGRALEYGCGTGGSNGLALARRGVQVDGIDISPVAIDQANDAARAAGLTDLLLYHVVDAEHLEFPAASFDLVFGSGILHHLDIEQSLSEIARVLRPDGRAVFFEPMGHNPAINLYRWLTPAMRTPDEHPLLVGDFALARRFFGVVQTDLHVLAAFGALPLRRTRWYGRAIDQLGGLDQRIFRHFPAMRRFGWIVVLELREPLSS